MHNLKADLPILAVTNPILLWLFKHGWEDPEWGHTVADQHIIALSIHSLASKISDADIRKQIQSAAARAVLQTAEEVVRESR
jgi:hypothetical protein